MTVHRRGTLAPTASDMQTTHQGVKLMLKVLAWSPQADGTLRMVAK